MSMTALGPNSTSPSFEPALTPCPHGPMRRRCPARAISLIALRHPDVVLRRSDLFVVVPAGHVQDRDVDLVEAVLVALELPVLVERRVCHRFAPALAREPGDLVELDEREVLVHVHPVHAGGALRHPSR